jgi:hypothetical protein
MFVSGATAVSPTVEDTTDLSQALVQEHVVEASVDAEAVKAAAKAKVATAHATSDAALAVSETAEKVREYFSDAPIMQDIAWCESRMRQFNTDGTAIRGIVNNADVGVMQINETYHKATAIKLGLDLTTLEGNMAYGRYLYETQGTRPWVHSKPCWGAKEIAYAAQNAQ